MYYCGSRKGFAFASEIKGLLQLVPEEKSFDPVALYRYSSFLWCPGEGTPFKSARKLLPGEAMVVRKGHIERHGLSGAACLASSSPRGMKYSTRREFLPV